MLARAPRKKVDKAEMAAVAVTRSRLTSFLQRRYSEFAAQMGSSAVESQTQVPPLSATMLELTAKMYAMAKKEMMPARISVRKREPCRSRGYVSVSAVSV